MQHFEGLQIHVSYKVTHPTRTWNLFCAAKLDLYQLILESCPNTNIEIAVDISLIFKLAAECAQVASKLRDNVNKTAITTNGCDLNETMIQRHKKHSRARVT